MTAGPYNYVSYQRAPAVVIDVLALFTHTLDHSFCAGYQIYMTSDAAGLIPATSTAASMLNTTHLNVYSDLKDVFTFYLAYKANYSNKIVTKQFILDFSFYCLEKPVGPINPLKTYVYQMN